MRKFLCTAVIIITGTMAFSQNQEHTIPPEGGVTTGNEKQVIALNSRNKSADKTDNLEITGMGGIVFSAMNFPDGSSRGGKYALKISLALLTGPNKATGYQLVFAPEGSTINYSVETQNGITSINLPMSTYSAISQKLEQNIVAKKKMQLKITQNPDGFKEAILAL
jgi:hypothetical protein